MMLVTSILQLKLMFQGGHFHPELSSSFGNIFSDIFRKYIIISPVVNIFSSTATFSESIKLSIQISYIFRKY